MIKIEFVSLSLLLKQLSPLLIIVFIVLISAYINGLNTNEDENNDIDDRIKAFKTKALNMIEEQSLSTEEKDNDEYVSCSYCGTANELNARACVACGAPRKKAFA